MEDSKNIINENANDSKSNTEVEKENTAQQNPNTEINTITQNQIQEAQGDNIPEISNENQNNEQGKEIQPQQNQQINNQENQQQAMNQVQPQSQPQLPPEKKIIFNYPMYNYCSEEKIKEIENCPPMNLFALVNKRKEEVSFKLQDILSKHEQYTLFQLYYKISKIFLTNKQYGKDPKSFFKAKDPSLRLKISDFDFNEVLNMLNCQLKTDEFNLILKSLTQKTNTLYSYDEFLQKVNNIQKEENGQIRNIYKQCSFYFNDYLYSFRHYIQDNRIDYKNAFIRVCGGMTTLTYEIFSKFLNEIGFKIGHEQEKQFLFSSLSENNYYPGYMYVNINTFILKKTLFEMAELSDITEEEFIKSGLVSPEKAKKNLEWTKNIKNYTEETKELYKENYKSFAPTFKGIREKCIRYDINDLTTYFIECREDISPEGEINIDAFKDLMKNIGVSYNVQFDTLIAQFKIKNKSRNALQLADFLSIYNLFSEDDKINVNDSQVKFEKENIKSTELVPEKEVNYVFKNAHRKFTQDDIDYISEFCAGIADIIIDEKHDSVTNFFRKKNSKNEAYFFLDELKEILEKDLEISLEGTEQEMEDFKIFFDFITDDQMVQGKDIVEKKKLIHIITYYSGKDVPRQTTISNDRNNLGNSNSNNKITFDEETNIRGTENPNLGDKQKYQNEDINTSSNINNINNINKNEEQTEIINTDINTSSISFDKLMSNFAQCLYYNRIRFSDAFPSISLEKIINNQEISSETLRQGFENANFRVNDKEFSVIMTHFDPINSNKVSVEELKHEIAKYQPKYFSQSYQRVIKPQINKDYVTMSTTFRRDISKSDLLNGMNKIHSFLNKNNISPDNFFYGSFCKKNRNANQQITKEAWKNSFIPKEKIQSEIIPYLTAKEVDAIYFEISKLSEPILLSQIIDFFNKYMNKNESMMKFDDKTSLNETIKNEIKILFDNFDLNKNDQISFDDFYKCLKSVDHKATKNDARNILAEHTNKNFNNVDRDTFNDIIYKYIQKSLFIQREEKDYIMNLFREADIDKNGYLTRNQIKYLITNKINSNLSDSELDEILDKVDIQNENEIDIRDFIFLLDNINNTVNLNNTNMINTMSNGDDKENIPIMNLNLNLNMHRKIRPKDFISLYTGLPLSFIPSFIREEQQRKKLLPSSCLKPLTKDDILYEDIFPIDTIIFSDTKNPNQISGIIQAKKLKEYNPVINCKIYFDDYATGVSSPDESLFETPHSQFKVVGRLLKISLFNNMYKVFVGNAVSIDCIYKKEYQDRWYFEDDDSKYNNNIIIRYNRNDYNEIDVVFEFVLVIQKKVEQKLYTVETSCGWCSIPMQDLLVARKEKIRIMGGSPLSVSDISEYDIRKKRIGFIPKLATLFEGTIRSECPIRVKLFNDLSNEEKKHINYLPGLIVCHSAAAQMISLYRQELGEYILNHKDYLLKSIKDEFDLGNLFCKIADVPDAFRVMNEIWKEIVIDGATSDQRNKEEYLRANFEIYVRKINSVLYAEKFKYNHLDPTELPRGDIKLMQDRDILLNSVLRAGLNKKFNKLEYKMDNYSYKPFTMDEINGEKGNSILEKIDEMITSFGN